MDAPIRLCSDDGQLFRNGLEVTGRLSEFYVSNARAVQGQSLGRRAELLRSWHLQRKRCFLCLTWIVTLHPLTVKGRLIVACFRAPY